MKSAGKRFAFSFDLLDQDPGLDAIEISQVFVEHHLPADQVDALLDRGRGGDLQRRLLRCQVGHAYMMANALELIV
jgi:hypothetical protein